MSTPSAFCSSRLARRWVLVGWLLVVLVAGASPWLSDTPLGPLCRGLADAAASAAPGSGAGHTLDCPACLPLQAGPPAVTALPRAAAATEQPVPLQARAFPDPQHAALPPVRGPPTA